MDDLISRQAAIRWIKTECNPYGKPTLDYETSCRIMEHLDKMPSAVIMCKDCVHRPIIDNPDGIGGFGLRFPDFRCPCRCDDEYYSRMPNDNWFCGNGEKEEKTNEREGRETSERKA